ncbi:MAG TPA: S9 family peptidase, partial [Thermomicrobiaceae bacterium]|nr:S9 family peptidase [Thermomicrobiaceae bacterium]
WSPDGRHIAYTSAWDPENPDETAPDPNAPPRARVVRRFDYKSDGRGYLGDKRNQLWVVDVESGKRRRLTGEPFDHGAPSWSPDGLTIATSIATTFGSQLGLIDVLTGAVRKFGTASDHSGSPAFSPSGAQIVYTNDPGRTGQPDIYLLDVASGASRQVTEELEMLPAGGFMGGARVWEDERHVLFPGMYHGGSGLYELDIQSGAVERIAHWQTQQSGLSLDASKRYVVQAYNALDATGEISVYDRQRDSLAVITRFNAELLDEAKPADWELVTIERAGFTIEGWLLRPADFDPVKRYPLVLSIHGGPQGMYGYGFNALNEVYATNGFFVLACNPRGSVTYGRAFTQAVLHDWGGEDRKDLMALLDKVLERPEIDAERTGMFGYSYGGYMTSWLLGQTSRFKACVCGAPVFDIESEIGTSDISFNADDHQWGGRPHENKEWYETHSSSYFAHRATTPTLIIQGEADIRCPVGQAEELFVALKQAGVETVFARYPGGYHGFIRTGPPTHREDVLERSLGWFKSHLGEPE